MRNRPMLGSLLAVGLLVAPSLALGQQAVDQRPPRTFSEFAGTWVRADFPANPTPPAPLTRGLAADPLNCTTSPACTPVGALDPNATPVVAPEPQLIITTSPTHITLKVIPGNPNSPGDVYRVDGAPTNMGTGQGTLTLAAGSLLLTRTPARRGGRGNLEAFTVTTDLLSVSGDVLTIERQYTRIVRPLDGDKVGHIAAPNDGGDARLKMIYRRQTAPTQ